MKAIRAAFAKPAPAPSPPPKMTFVYVTCRKNSRLEWFLDSLYNQVKEIGVDTSNIQLVIVDFYLQYDQSRLDYVRDRVRGRFEFVHVPPKPSPWQGKYRITKTDCFSASLARNTGICYVKNPYVFFIDDLSVLKSGSFQHMLQYAKDNRTVAFSYRKVFGLNVDNGSIVSMIEHPAGVDSRDYIQGSLTSITGGQFYGYAGLSLDTILKVNGYDEICSSYGYEDIDCGFRLEKNGEPLYYSKDVMFYETEDIVDEVHFHRRDPLLSKDDYHLLMDKYGVTKRRDEGRTDISHFLLDLLTRGKSWTEGNDYNLAELRTKILNGGSFQDVFDPEMKTIEGVFLYDIESPNIVIVNEHGNRVDTNRFEKLEQDLAQEYISANDVVFELGGRYGSVSCVINKKLKCKTNHVVVEPDERVWEALERNKTSNNCMFHIVKGFVSKKPLGLAEKESYDGYGTTSVDDIFSSIPSYTLERIEQDYGRKFNVLVADCEGFLETFFDENPDFYDALRLILFEADYPNKCNYVKIRNTLHEKGFTELLNGHQNVWIRQEKEL